MTNYKGFFINISSSVHLMPEQLLKYLKVYIYYKNNIVQYFPIWEIVLYHHLFCQPSKNLQKQYQGKNHMRCSEINAKYINEIHSKSHLFPLWVFKGHVHDMVDTHWMNIYIIFHTLQGHYSHSVCIHKTAPLHSSIIQ